MADPIIITCASSKGGVGKGCPSHPTNLRAFSGPAALQALADHGAAARFVIAAGLAARISRSRRERCSPATSFRSALISLPFAMFRGEVKGKNALALTRDLSVSYKTAFVLLHKLREAVSSEMKGRMIGGASKIAEVDGGYFGGYQKPANLKENRRDRRLAKNQNGKRQVVIIVRERGGNSLPAVFKSESHAGAFIRSRVAKGTILNADEAGSWNALHERFEVRRINHEEAYSLDDACTNWPKAFSHACAALRSGITIISQARIYCATPRKAHGGKITAVCRTGIRSSDSRD